MCAAVRQSSGQNSGLPLWDPKSKSNGRVGIPKRRPPHVPQVCPLLASAAAGCSLEKVCNVLKSRSPIAHTASRKTPGTVLYRSSCYAKIRISPLGREKV